MKGSSRRKEIRKLFFSILLLIGLAGGAVVIGRAVWGLVQKDQTAQERHSEAQDELKVLTERKEALEEELHRLQTERGIEQELREKFPIAKPGEELVVLVNDDEEDGRVDESENGIWDKLRGWFR